MDNIQQQSQPQCNQNPEAIPSNPPANLVSSTSWDASAIDPQLLENIQAALHGILQTPRISYQRDKETEIRIVEAHKVELLLKSMIGTCRVYDWLRYARFVGSVYEIGIFRLIGKTHRPVFFDGTRDLATIAAALKQGAKAMEAYVEHVKNIKPAIPTDPNASRPFVEIAGTLLFFATELNRKTASFQNVPVLHLGQIVDMSTNNLLDCSRQQTPWSAECLELYMRLNDMTDYEEAVTELKKILAVDTGSLLDQPKLHERGHWRHARRFIRPPVPPALEGKVSGLTFLDRHGRFSHDVQTHYRDDGTKVILPLTVWVKRDQVFSFPLYVPPESPFPLLNQYLMKQHPGIPVVLTDSVELAGMLMQQQGDGRLPQAFLVSTWYSDGSVEAIDRIDPTPLHGRAVYIVMADTCSEAPELARTRMARLYDLLAAKGIPARILDFTSQADGFRNAGYLVPRDSLPVINDAPTTTEPLREPQGKFFLRKPSDLKNAPPPEYLIEPIIEIGGCYMLYAAASAGKTFVTLKLACSLSSNSLVFGKWQAKKPGRCLYIGGEMTENSIGRRLAGIISQFDAKEQASIESNLRVAMLGGKRPNLATEDGQRQIEEMIDEIRRDSDYREKVDLIFLDNMLCLVPGFSNVEVWNRFSLWLDSLKNRGIAVLLVNHVTKNDTEFGTGALMAAVDNAIRVRKLPSEKKNFLRLHISIHKARDLDDDAQEAIEVQFSPNDYTQPWEVLVPHDDGRDSADQIRTWMADGLTDREIAEKQNLSLDQLKKLKGRLGLTKKRKTTKSSKQTLSSNGVIAGKKAGKPKSIGKQASRKSRSVAGTSPNDLGTSEDQD